MVLERPRIRCFKCGMTFRQELPARKNNNVWSRCAEPGCDRFFWSCAMRSGPVRIGVNPQENYHGKI